MCGREDQSRIETLFTENYQKLVAMVKNDISCLPIAEDIVQEVFCEALNHAKELKEHRNPAGWLAQTAKYKMLAARRKLSTRSRLEEIQYELEMGELESQFGAIELGMLLDSTLNLHEKTLFYLYYMQGYRARELARAEGISENSFKVRMHRIRKKLQESLEG